MWVFFALSSALSLAAVDAFSKKTLERADVYVVTWIRFLFAAPFLIAVLFFVPIPDLPPKFWVIILALVPMELLAVVLYVRAIKASPLSLSIPFLSFTPAFLILTGYIILGESVKPEGAAGIFLIVLGAYLLHAHTISVGFLEPFRAIFRETGSLLMMAVAFIYSITSGLGKLGVLYSSPATFGSIYFLILTAAFTPIALLRSRQPLSQIRDHWRAFASIGFFQACMVIFHFLAIAGTAAAYMIAVKRTSMLFSIVFGYLYFGEGRLRQRLGGSMVMLAGVAVILFQA